jgi:hypothetical protein
MFVIADYGSAMGRNSVASVRVAVEALRARRPHQAVAVIHNDLPKNDWNELFANAARRDAFELIECRTDPIANTYLERWRTDHDAAAYARSYSAFGRAFTESNLREHLFSPAGEADAALDEYFARLTDRFAADPERDRFEDWTLTVVLARR